MRVMNVNCGTCLGYGTVNPYIKVSDGVCRSIEQTCPECGGKGHFEYALFSIEEATELMERCGMDAKELES